MDSHPIGVRSLFYTLESKKAGAFVEFIIDFPIDIVDLPINGALPNGHLLDLKPRDLRLVNPLLKKKLSGQLDPSLTLEWARMLFPP